ncbi:MAG: DUF1905 domain-containing protein [Acidobacteriota bacterium]|nr:DUF1905 domain-containing protein [Acidobacteriota bacterium]
MAESGGKPPGKSFKAPLESTGNSLAWVIARIPVDLKKAWPGWGGRRVHGTINGFAFSTSLFPGPKGQGLTLLVNKKMQAGAKARPGDKVTLRLEPDMAKRAEHPLPKELADIFKSERALRKWFEALPPSYIKGIGAWVAEPKSAESRLKRAEQMAERLILTMEGEHELPPILRVAFDQQPLAHEGWAAMTPTQRRNHLFGVFYYQSAGSRQKRVAHVVEEAITAARRKRGEKTAAKNRRSSRPSKENNFADLEHLD